MGLLALGVNHNTASVDIRERVSLVPEQIEAFLQFAKEEVIADEVIVLSTCNRTELYFHQLNVAYEELVSVWSKYTNFPADQLINYLYELKGAAAAEHLFKVAAGLDSLILGEAQIFGQLKQSLAQSTAHNMAKKHLNRLFQLSFNVAKEIRTKTNIGAYAVSVAFTAVQLARQIFDGLERHQVLLVGAGETTELVARHLIESGVRNLNVANRSQVRAQNLIKTLGVDGKSYSLDHIPELIKSADIVVSSTAADHALITKEMAKKALKARKNQPILMIDLAVPRDIEASVAKLADIYLYTVDDLNMIVEDNQRSREEAAKEAQYYVHEGVKRWEDWLAIADLGETLTPIEAYAEVMKKRSVRQAVNHLHGSGIEMSDEVLTQLAAQLSNRLMHPIIEYIKDLERNGKQESLDQLLKEFR